MSRSARADAAARASAPAPGYAVVTTAGRAQPARFRRALRAAPSRRHEAACTAPAPTPTRPLPFLPVPLAPSASATQGGRAVAAPSPCALLRDAARFSATACARRLGSADAYLVGLARTACRPLAQRLALRMAAAFQRALGSPCAAATLGGEAKRAISRSAQTAAAATASARRWALATAPPGGEAATARSVLALAGVCTARASAQAVTTPRAARHSSTLPRRVTAFLAGAAPNATFPSALRRAASAAFASLRASAAVSTAGAALRVRRACSTLRTARHRTRGTTSRRQPSTPPPWWWTRRAG